MSKSNKAKKSVSKSESKVGSKKIKWMSALAAPSIEVARAASASTSVHRLYLIFKNDEIPTQLKKVLPSQVLEHGAVNGDQGVKLALHANSQSNLIFGLGTQKRFNEQEAAEWGEAAGHFALAERLTNIEIIFPTNLKHEGCVSNFVKGFCMAPLKWDYYKTSAPKKLVEFENLTIVTSAGNFNAQAVEEIEAVVPALAFARQLSEAPQRLASPQGICEIFEAFADRSILDVEIWDEKKIAKEKMGLLQAVAQGSDLPPRFLIVRYNANLGPKVPSLFLVGKGVTFDTGGINLKTSPWRELLGMKKDMSGASAVLGSMIALAKTRPHIRVTAVVPLTTNSIDAKSVIPGDIITSYSGKTVEIGNTDAEGRLILADAVHYAKLQKADYIVDVATLTGACAVALGQHYSGLFSNESKLQGVVTEACQSAGEPVWPMPTSQRYQDEIKSPVADLSNMGKSREGGASIGAIFIEHFVDQTPWVHLDIAGCMELGAPAAAGAQVKSSGRMVHALVRAAHALSTKK